MYCVASVISGMLLWRVEGEIVQLPVASTLLLDEVIDSISCPFLRFSSADTFDPLAFGMRQLFVAPTLSVTEIHIFLL